VIIDRPRHLKSESEGQGQGHLEDDSQHGKQSSFSEIRSCLVR